MESSSFKQVPPSLAGPMLTQLAPRQQYSLRQLAHVPCPIGTFPNRILTFPVAIAGTAIGFNQTLSTGTGTLDLTAAQLANIFTGATLIGVQFLAPEPRRLKSL